MLYSFKNILLPVDLNQNTEIAVKKTIELADTKGTVIHIMHVLRPERNKSSLFAEITLIPIDNNNRRYVDKIEKLNEWKEFIEKAIPDSEVRIYLIRGKPVEKMIIQKAKEIHAQLIIMARQTDRQWFHFKKNILASNIAIKTHSAVLTIKPGALRNKIKSIVLPIRSFIPRRKVDILFPLVYNKGTTIYLVSLMNEESDDFDYSSAFHALIETYRLLKEEANCQIVHKLVKGNTLAKTLLQFAESVQADILLLNPDESRVWSFTGLRDFPDLLNRQSGLQIMAVDQYGGEL